MSLWGLIKCISLSKLVFHAYNQHQLHVSLRFCFGYSMGSLSLFVVLLSEQTTTRDADACALLFSFLCFPIVLRIGLGKLTVDGKSGRNEIYGKQYMRKT